MKPFHTLRTLPAALLISLLTGLLPAACNSVECTLNNTVYTTYGFYTRTDDTEAAIIVNDTLTITAGGSDSVLINRMYNAKKVELPMSYFDGVDTLAFAVTNKAGETVRDTIWVSKTNYEHYEAPDCPIAIFHHVTGVRSTHRLIDTVKIVNPNVNYHASENFRIYFYTAQ